MHVSNRIADDSRWSMELIEDFASCLINCFEPAIERSVENQTAVCRQCSTVHLERLIDGPLGLSTHRVEGDEPPANVAVVCRKHRHGGADVWKAALVFHSERLVVHTDVIRSC